MASGSTQGANGSRPTEPAHAPTWGEHGMVLFGGRDGLFASHLPMFHAPHDYHVVIALQVADPKIESEMRRRLAEKPALWTLVPEEFELARLAPGAKEPLLRFKADIVEGHFERGGRTVHAGVEVRVLRTEQFVALDPQGRPARVAHYEPVGQGGTWFLVKEVRARPDFDHVVMLSTHASPDAIDVPVSGVVQPSDRVLAAQLRAHAKIVGTVYYDTEDLR
jgi:hypothetical protein